MNTYGDQTKLEEHLLKCIEQEFCKESYMPPNWKTTHIGWYLKVDLPLWIAADFECSNVLYAICRQNMIAPVESTIEKLFVSKPLAKVCSILEKIYYENSNWEKKWIYQVFWCSFCWMVHNWDVRKKDYEDLLWTWDENKS